MAIDDGVDLVRAGGRLVHTLAVGTDCFLAFCPEAVEGGNLAFRQSRCPGNGWQIVLPRRGKRCVKAVGMVADPLPVAMAVFVQPHQQAIEQRRITVGFDGQMRICQIGGSGPARIDQHDAHLRIG